MKRDRELDEEIASHLRMAIEERVARGESRESAERAARRELGNVAHIKEVTREMHGGVWLERVVQDFRYGARALRRTPSFTITAIVTLALAIGANSAVFTVVNSVLLRPLPFRDPGQLYLVSHLPTDLPFEPPPGLADGDWLGYRDRARSFEQVSAYNRTQVTMSGSGDATRLTGARVDADFLPVLGVSPALGRGFVRNDEMPGSNRVVVISDRLWRERFGVDSNVLGRSISLDGLPHTIVGVMPAGFVFPASSEIWMPLSVQLDRGNSFILSVLGRLRAGATREQARAELSNIMRAVPGDPRDRERTMVAAVLPLRDVKSGPTGKGAFALWLGPGTVAHFRQLTVASDF